MGTQITETKVKYYLKANGYIYLTVNKQNITTKIKIDSRNWQKGFPKRTQTLLINRLNNITKRIQALTPQQLTKDNIIKCIKDISVNINTLEPYYFSFLKTKEKHTTGTYNNTVKALKVFTVIIPLNTLIAKLTTTKIIELNEYIDNRNFADGTLKVYIAYIRQFIKYIEKREKELFVSDEIGVQLSKKTSGIIALDKKELEQLELLEVPKHLQRTKDLYLLSCYTGSRHSDLEVLINTKIKDGVITMEQLKTKEVVTVIINKQTEKLINKLKQFDFTKDKSKSLLNINIKAIFRLLNLDRKVSVRGNYIDIAKAVTFHSSRKTFITRALSKDIPYTIVMKLSGHKDFKSFQKYINHSKNDIKEYAHLL